MSDTDKLTRAIVHYQQSLERYIKHGNNAKMLHCIFKLYSLPVTTAHLEETGVGRTVNSLRRLKDEVGEAARTLVTKWKNMVSQQDEYTEPSENIETGRKSDSKDYENNSSHKDSDGSKSYVRNDRNRETSADDKRKSLKEAEYMKVKENASHMKHKDQRSRSKERRRISVERRSCNSEESHSDSSEKSESDRDRSNSNASDSDARDRSSSSEKDRSVSNCSDRSVSDEGASSGFEDEQSDDSTDQKIKAEHRERSKRAHSKDRSSSKQKSSSHSHVTEESRTKLDSKQLDKQSHKTEHKDRSHSKDERQSSHAREKETKSQPKEKSQSHKKEKDVKSHSSHKNRSRNEKRKHESSDSSDDDRKLKKSKHEDNSRKRKRDDGGVVIYKHKKRSDSSDSASDNEVYNSRSSKRSMNKSDSSKGGSEKKEKERREHKYSASQNSSKSDGKKDAEVSKRKGRDETASKDSSNKSKAKEESTKNDKKSDRSSSSSSSGSKHESKSKNKETSKSHGQSMLGTENGICSGFGASFAEALGMLEPTTSKGVRKSKSLVKVGTPEKTSPGKVSDKKSVKPEIVIPPPPPKVEPIDINISSLLPTITPNYRPLGNCLDILQNSRNKVVNEDDALCMVMSSKNQRTKVYSGNKCMWNTVPTLFELCTRVLQDNIDALEYTGGVPYTILKPVLDKATPDQLFVMEHHNPYLIEDTDDLWHFHCQKEFRNKKREELESWREMYMRCLDEREVKLKTLMANIKESQDKSTPVRKTQLAYVDSVAKPPRNVLRKQLQAKNGIEKRPYVTPSSRLTALATAGAAGQVVVPNPGSRASSSGGGNSSAHVKPKKAPLMQKTLAFLKGGRFRR